MKWYLIKVSGSQGCIFDFSQAEVADENRLCELIKTMGGDPDSAHIQYHAFDERINFHSWHMLADIEGYKQQHIFWIYSTSEHNPYLSEY